MKLKIKLREIKKLQNEVGLLKNGSVETTEKTIHKIKTPKSFKIDDFIEYICDL